jgi:hypothetical protein
MPVFAPHKLFAVNVPGENLRLALMVQGKAATNPNRILAGTMDDGSPDFHIDNVLKQVIRVTFLATAAENNIPERTEHQVCAGLQRALAQHLMDIGIVGLDAPVLGDGHGLLFAVPREQGYLHTLDMNRFLAHVHQQAQGIRVLILGVVDHQVGPVVALYWIKNSWK